MFVKVMKNQVVLTFLHFYIQCLIPSIIMGAPTQAYVCESDDESGSFHFSVFLYIIADA